jgi:membrane protein DedA with SNARE-associated domain
VLAGMTKMSWRTFLFYNFIGSAGSTAGYILIGYFFGKEWKYVEAWFRPMWLYLSLVGISLIACGVIFRRSLSRLWCAYLAGYAAENSVWA